MISGMKFRRRRRKVNVKLFEEPEFMISWNQGGFLEYAAQSYGD